ncbi:MAG: PTS mannitol transporter subunit IICB [Microbacteriaceae bacterium]
MTTTSAATPRTGARVNVQRFGSFLSGMIMPNIAAFIAWGFITALFISTGWFPNGILGGFGEVSDNWAHAMTAVSLNDDGSTLVHYVGLVGPMITYLLPLLIANTGGRMVYGERGGVVASIATMGVIIGTTVPMFLGAMIMGPFAAWCMKKVDGIWAGKIKPGFEMLVDNFSAGILGMILAVIGFFGFGPVITAVSNALGAVTDWLTQYGLLPLLSLIVEPAKVLFLNNAINHGVFTPLGTQQALEQGQSLLFLVEANPGPGLGILLAFSFFGVGMARASAPGAIVIQFLGGIHEIYFPYVLMKPATIIAAIAGGATGVATNMIFHSGLRAPASPGSIFAVILQTPAGSLFGVLLSVLLAATVSFLITAVILRASRKRDLEKENAGDLSAAIAQTEANKGKASSVLGSLKTEGVHSIVFACDAGMGSSAMGASVLRNKLKAAGVKDVKVTNLAISKLTDADADLVITHQDLTERAKLSAPHAVHVSVENFMDSPRYDEIVAQVAAESVK